jgi:hypothetical protein
MNEIIDSYFYLAFGSYLRNGVYPFQAPFIYAKPTTISPPGYAILLMSIQNIPRADIIIHVIQLGLLILSAWLIYKISRYAVNTYVSIIIACLFFLIPGNLIYTSYMLSENGATFFVTLFLFLFVSFQKTKHIQYLGLLCIIGSLMTLWKYSCIVYLFFALLLVLFQKSKHVVHYMLPTGAILIILLWMSMNFAITGRVGLSDSSGIQLWNQAVWVGNILPSETRASMQKLRTYIPRSVDMKRAYWDLQGYILNQTNNDWKTVDTVLGNVAKDAVIEYPVQYLSNTWNIFLRLHIGKPFWHNLGYFGNDDPNYPLFCGTLWSFSFCRPIISTPISFALWNRYVAGASFFYEIVFPVFAFLLFYPLLFFLLIKGSNWEKLIVLLYFLGVIPIAMYVHPDPRYLIPFYPIMTIIMVFSGKRMYREIRNIKFRFQQKKK